MSIDISDEALPSQAQKMKIFVSYSRSDMTTVDLLVDALETRGFICLIDRRDLEYGEKWQGMLRDFIAEADSVVFVVTPRSVTSEWCRWEMAEVAKRSKRLVPIMLEHVSSNKMPPELSEWHIMPFNSVENQEKQIADLVATLLADRGWVQEHTRLAGLALTWEASKHPPDSVLQGVALASAESWKSAPRKVNLLVDPRVEAFISESRAADSRRSRKRFRIAWSIGVGALSLAIFALLQWVTAQTNQKLAEEQRELAQRSEVKAISARDEAIASETIATSEKSRNETLRIYFQAKDKLSQGETIVAQLLALEISDRLPSLEQAIGAIQVRQMYYDVFLSLFAKPIDAPMRTSIVAPPLRGLRPRLVDPGRGCVDDECKTLELLHPSFRQPIEINCRRSEFCYWNTQSDEKPIAVPHPAEPVALISLDTQEDWRLFSMGTRSLSKNIFPSRLTCIDDECHGMNFGGNFLGPRAILWHRRLSSIDDAHNLSEPNITGNVVATTRDGIYLGQHAEWELSKGRTVAQRGSSVGFRTMYQYFDGAPFVVRKIAYNMAELSKRAKTHKIGTKWDGVVPEEVSAGLFGDARPLARRNEIVSAPDRRIVFDIEVSGRFIGIDDECVVSTAERPDNERGIGETESVFCVPGLSRAKAVGLTRDGVWLVAMLEDAAYAWRVYLDVRDLIKIGSEEMYRCLTQEERKDALLAPSPPAWCLAVGQGTNAGGKWPYISKID